MTVGARVTHHVLSGPLRRFAPPPPVGEELGQAL